MRLLMVLLFGMFSLLLSCGKHEEAIDKTPSGVTLDTNISRISIAQMLDSFNLAAAHANYQEYFNYFTDDAVFCGTDATENWRVSAFKAWAKPHFESKKTWDFTSIQRNIYFGKHADIAWFDELLHTQMKICRGSGVVVYEEGRWKVQQYILSITLPNEEIGNAIKLKSPIEDSIINQLSPQ